MTVSICAFTVIYYQRTECPICLTLLLLIAKCRDRNREHMTSTMSCSLPSYHFPTYLHNSQKIFIKYYSSLITLLFQIFHSFPFQLQENSGIFKPPSTLPLTVILSFLLLSFIMFCPLRVLFSNIQLYLPPRSYTRTLFTPTSHLTPISSSWNVTFRDAFSEAPC